MALDMVYPRVCGGTRWYSGTARTSRGLSPRVRGNHVNGHAGQSLQGSIPACAGEPPELLVATLLEGETRSIPACAGEPDMTSCHRRPWMRSIPACAGEPFWIALVCAIRTVYPRVCGGTPWYAHADKVPAGSIPACAGEPDVELIALRALRGLSPRVRGNRVTLWTGKVVHEAVDGSIPACAGEPEVKPSRRWTSGIRSIPACAGEPRPP